MITKNKIISILKEKYFQSKQWEEIADEILALDDNKPNVQKVEPKYKSGDKVICKKSLIIGSPKHRNICSISSIHNLICANNTEGGTLGIFGIMSCIDPKFEEHFELYNEQEIKSDYEILSFKQDSGMTDLWTYFDNQGWARNNNGRMETKPYKTLDDIINNHLDGGVKYNINSVKRLSDGEVFTIDNKVRTSSYFSKGNIISFTINKDNKLLVDYKLDESIGFLNCVCDHLKNLIKVKTPILVTDNGVELFKDDTFYHVDSYWNIGVGYLHKDVFEKLKGYKYFSTKEAAEEYILLNKPCLSYNDIINSIKDSNLLRSLIKDDGLLISVMKSRILKIVKSKLK
jgi:hypothetical protein